MPAVTIAMVAHNRRAYIGEAIASALRQHGAECEVLVVDDGSTDGTPDIVRAIGDPRVRLVELGRNCGVAAARNRALAETRGQWMLVLDSDDRLLEDVLSAYASAFAEFPEANVLYGDWILPVAAAGAVHERRFLRYRDTELLSAFMEGCVIPFGGACLRVATMRRVGGFDERLRSSEDYDLLVRMAPFGGFHHVGRVVYEYRQHGDQLCGHENRGDPEMDGLVLDGMLNRHDMRELFPSCFGSEDQSDLAARIRLASVFEERRLVARRDRVLNGIIQSLLQSRVLPSELRMVAKELVRLSWMLRVRRHGTQAQVLTVAAVRALPGSPGLWKEFLLAHAAA